MMAATSFQGGAGDDLIYGFNPDGPQGQVSSIAATRVASGLSAAVVRRCRRPAITIACSSSRRKADPASSISTPDKLLPDALPRPGGRSADRGRGTYRPSRSIQASPLTATSMSMSSIPATTPRSAATRFGHRPDQANPVSQTLLLRIDQPDGLTNHKGGWVEFGADGYLYTSLGDGGGGGDPLDNAQNMDTCSAISCASTSMPTIFPVTPTATMRCRPTIRSWERPAPTRSGP